MNKLTEEFAIWIGRAIDDIRWTEANLKEGIYFGACFSAQQAVEKALKAYLLKRKGRFDKIHDLVRLTDLCIDLDPAFSPYRKIAASLSLYYIQTRYPDVRDSDLFTKEEAESAYDSAKRTVEFVQKLLTTE